MTKVGYVWIFKANKKNKHGLASIKILISNRNQSEWFSGPSTPLGSRPWSSMELESYIRDSRNKTNLDQAIRGPMMMKLSKTYPVIRGLSKNSPKI